MRIKNGIQVGHITSNEPQNYQGNYIAKLQKMSINIHKHPTSLLELLKDAGNKEGSFKLTTLCGRDIDISGTNHL